MLSRVTDLPPALSLSGIRKSFGGVAAVRGVSLDVAAGETVALLGQRFREILGGS